MAKIIHEVDIHLTKVVEVPDDYPEQVSYDFVQSKKEGKINKKSLYSLFMTLSPVMTSDYYDSVVIKKDQMFITEEGKKNDESGNESKSEGDVSADK